MDSVLLTFNTGSSTVKIGSFEYDGSSLQKSAKADIDFAATPLNFHMERGKERLDIELQTQESADIVAVLSEVLTSFQPISNFPVSKQLAIVSCMAAIFCRSCIN